MPADASVYLGENIAVLRTVFQIVQAFLFFSLLLAVSVWDIRHRIIPDGLQVGIASLALLDFSVGNISGILCILPYLVIGIIPGKQDGIEGGDIKLAGSTGLILGLPAGLAASLMGLTIFVVYGSGFRIIKRFQGNKEKKSLPLGPFLSAGCICAYYFKMKGWIY